MGLHSETHPTNIDEMTTDEIRREYINNFEYINRVAKVKPIAMSHPLAKYTDSAHETLKKLGLEIGFRDNMEEVNGRGIYEVARKDHAIIIDEMRIS